MIPYYVVDAFADAPFQGNPAGVCIVESWPDDATMLAIAAENRLSETAFAIRRGPARYDLRWFMPTGEIDLCGHATFGTAFALFRFHEPDAKAIHFHAPMKGYELVCTRVGNRIQMEFPRIPPQPFAFEPIMETAVGARPAEVLATERDLVLVFDDEAEVNGMQPNLAAVEAIPHGLSVYVTAPSATWDYVARAFWPKMGIPEDPVCGSMQSALVPYWAERLGKRELVCRQTSPRGGTVWCEDTGDAVLISGTGSLYLQGQIEIETP